jgi:hypothetical protein
VVGSGACNYILRRNGSAAGLTDTRGDTSIILKVLQDLEARPGEA